VWLTTSTLKMKALYFPKCEALSELHDITTEEKTVFFIMNVIKLRSL
jgi:hypothetical protein